MMIALIIMLYILLISLSWFVFKIRLLVKKTDFMFLDSSFFL